MADLAVQANIAVTPERSIFKENAFLKTLVLYSPDNQVSCIASNIYLPRFRLMSIICYQPVHLVHEYVYTCTWKYMYMYIAQRKER